MPERDPLDREELPPMPPGWMPATAGQAAALREDISRRILPVGLDLAFLSSHGALAGVAEIIAERRRQVEQQDEALGRPNLCYAAEAELGFGNYAKAAALLAAVIDGTRP
jgi:hypothetical protein